MFDAYIDELRSRRCHVTALASMSFEHLETHTNVDCVPDGCSGWTLWVAQSGSDSVALCWPWTIIPPGVAAIEPLKIQSNLLVVDAAGYPLSEYLGLSVLVQLVNKLPWHVMAERACRMRFEGKNS